VEGLGVTNSNIYSYLMATIGGKFAARLAGNTPKNTPIKVETPKAIITANAFIATGKKGLIAKTINTRK